MNPLGEMGRFHRKKPNPGKCLNHPLTIQLSDRQLLVKTRRCLSRDRAQPLVHYGRFKDADCTSSWHRFIRCARQTDVEIVMARFVLSSPSNSALLPSLRIAPCELLLRPTPFPVTLVYAWKGLPTFSRWVCNGGLPIKRGTEPGRQSDAMQLMYKIERRRRPCFRVSNRDRSGSFAPWVPEPMRKATR